MPATKKIQPTIRIPAEYKAHHRLVAVSEQDYAAIRAKTTNNPTFRKRSLAVVAKELAAAYPNDATLVTDVIEGLKQSSLYAKRPTASR
jgi:hypothetical protein